jgi:DNA-binding NarL/FixJ family response regulator
VKICAIVYSPIRLFADGVAQCLADAPNVEAAACCSLDQLAELLGRGDAEILLFDVTDESALAAARSMIRAYPQVGAIALALPEVLERVIACADLGFVSYVPRDASMTELGDIVARAVRREVLCDPAVAGGLLRELRRRAAAQTGSRDSSLTRREHQVFAHLSNGLTNKEIARMLGLSAATVKNHVHSILTKTRIRRRGDVRAHPQPLSAIAATVAEDQRLPTRVLAWPTR